MIIYSVDPAHKSAGGKKNEIATVKKKIDGDSGAGNVPHKKGIHKCDTTTFGAEHKSTKKTSVLLLPISGGTLGFFWSIHEKAPLSGKKMSEVTGKTKIGTSNRKIVWVKSSGLSASTYSTVAHEFQHLLYYGHDEASSKGLTWTNEGLSVYSVDLNNYWTGNSTYESRLTKFIDVYKNHNSLSSLRITDSEWSGRNSTDVQYCYAISGIWTLYLAKRFPGKIDEYGQAKDDHNSDVFKQATVSSDSNDTFKNIFAEWALANCFNKIMVAIKKNSKPISILSDISNFATDVDAGKYNYYVEVENSGIADGTKKLKIPNTAKIRELELKVPDGTVQANSQKTKPTTPLTTLTIIKASVGYLNFKFNSTPTEDKRLHIFVKQTGDIAKMYTVEEGRDDKTCFVNESTPTSSKEITFVSHNNQKMVTAVLPNHTTSSISVKYIAYYTEPPEITKMVFSQAGSRDKETLAAKKTSTMNLSKSGEVTIKIYFNQEMTTDKGEYTLKDGDTIGAVTKTYYGNESKKDQIEAPSGTPKKGEVLKFPFKTWFVYDGETTENDFTVVGWSKTTYTNDTLTLKCTPTFTVKKRNARIFVCGAANFGKDVMVLENAYKFGIRFLKALFKKKTKKRK
jgi:hypothetical protein